VPAGLFLPAIVAIHTSTFILPVNALFSPRPLILRIARSVRRLTASLVFAVGFPAWLRSANVTSTSARDHSNAPRPDRALQHTSKTIVSLAKSSLASHGDVRRGRHRHGDGHRRIDCQVGRDCHHIDIRWCT
jgi:hypothetical protein